MKPKQSFVHHMEKVEMQNFESKLGQAQAIVFYKKCLAAIWAPLL